MYLPLKLKVPGRLFYVRLRKVPGIECGATLNKNCPASGAVARPWQLSKEKMSNYFLICHTCQQNCSNSQWEFGCSYQLWTLNIQYAVFMQKMLFVAVLLCDFYANCVDIMQIVLILCKLCCFYANCEVFMQIMTFITIYTVLSQMTFLSRNTRFSRHFWACYQALITFNDVCR